MHLIANNCMIFFQRPSIFLLMCISATPKRRKICCYKYNAFIVLLILLCQNFPVNSTSITRILKLGTIHPNILFCNSATRHCSHGSHHSNYSNRPHEPWVSPVIQSTERKISDPAGLRTQITHRTWYHSTKDDYSVVDVTSKWAVTTAHSKVGVQPQLVNGKCNRDEKHDFIQLLSEHFPHS